MNIYQILPLNLVSGIRSFENINKSILPSNKEFLAIRLTSFDDENIGVDSGLFRYNLEEDGLFLSTTKNDDVKSLVLLEQGKEHPKGKFYHQYLLNAPLPKEETVNIPSVLDIEFKGDKKKDFEIAWNLGRQKIKLGGGIINGADFKRQSIMLRQAKRILNESDLSRLSFDGDDIKKGRLPYITITITFP